MPVIGVLSGGSPDSEGEFLKAFMRSLGHAGYDEGRNVAFEYRWANDHLERLPALAADLARRNVTLILSLSGTITVLAARSVTQTIPIVFVTGGDPVKAGIVASLNRPGGNITGISVMGSALNDKRLEVSTRDGAEGRQHRSPVQPQQPERRARDRAHPIGGQQL